MEKKQQLPLVTLPHYAATALRRRLILSRVVLDYGDFMHTSYFNRRVLIAE
jgi:hypothetical protein